LDADHSAECIYLEPRTVAVGAERDGLAVEVELHDRTHLSSVLQASENARILMSIGMSRGLR
jgi:hypothetical protein